jgi:hypothetical protein
MRAVINAALDHAAVPEPSKEAAAFHRPKRSVVGHARGDCRRPRI